MIPSKQAALVALPLPADGDLFDSLENVLDDRTRSLIQERRASAKPRRRAWMMHRALAAADIVGLLAAFLLAEWLFPAHATVNDRVTPLLEIGAFVATLPLWVVLAKLYGLYDRDSTRTDHTTVDDVFGVFNFVTVGMWLFVASAWLTGLARPTVGKLLVFWVAAITLVSLFRAIARTYCRRQSAYVQNTLIMGAGHVGQKIARKLLQHPEYGANIVGFVDEHPRTLEKPLAEVAVIGHTENLGRLVADLDVERVIVAFSQHPHAKTLALVRELNELGVQVDVVPRLYEVLGPHVQVHAAEGMPLLGLPATSLSPSALFVKRATDIALSAIGLVALSPLLLVIAVAIKLDSQGPVVFRQTRMGANGKTFRILKFRTMAADAEQQKSNVAHLNKHRNGDARMFKIENDPRTTRIGTFLRRYSLDELPQLCNVLCGDMSLVGPRPLILEEHAHVNGWGAKRLDLKPGITGLWQVLGRDDIPFNEMVELDYRYVTSWSMLADLKLIVRTVPTLVQRGA